MLKLAAFSVIIIKNGVGEIKMRYSNSFGKKSSKILLGTAYFGDTISESDAFAIMDRYYALGGRHIDTARLYVQGEAEKVIAKWIKSRKPEELFLSTKGAFPLAETPDVSRLSENEIRYDLELSLKALELDCVEFYWLHRDDESIPCETIIDTMNKLKKEGKIKHFGASNWNYYRIQAANEYAKANGLQGFEASQLRFSPAVIAPQGNADRTLVDMTSESFDYYANVKMPVCAYASQAKGFFSKMDSIGENGLSPKSKDRYLCSENLERLDMIRQLARKYNCSIAACVCACLCSLSSPDVFPIIGGSNIKQIEDSMSGADIIIDKQELRNLFKYNIQ